MFATPLRFVIGFVLALLCQTTAWTHGMHFTSAEVIQRHDNQLYVTVRTSLRDLFAQLQYPQKPSSMLDLASQDITHVLAFRQAVLRLFQSQFQMSINSERIQRLAIHTASSQSLLEMFKHEVAEQVLKGHNTQSLTPNDRSNFLRIDIEALLPAASQRRQLDIQFPVELGTISVSYSKPQYQLVKNGATATVYSQQLD